jgi:broad specificity phosphatase PhoE
MLILVRHGRTEANAQARLQGRLDLPLDEVGQQQAASIAERLGTPDLLITSPLLRARQTAEHFGADTTIDPRWVEISYGAYEGLPFDEVASETWDRWYGDVHFCPPDGESLFTLGERVVDACEELLPLARDRDVVVVTHVSPMKAAVAWALGVDLHISWRTHLDHASVCRVKATPRGPSLVSFNERLW